MGILMDRFHRARKMLPICILLLALLLSGCEEKESESGKKRLSNNRKQTEMITNTPTQKSPTAPPIPTVTPTPTMTPTPSETGYAETGETMYGELIQYLDISAEEVIQRIGKEYGFGFWGSGEDLERGTSGGFAFDDEVGFFFTSDRKEFDTDDVVRIIECYQDETNPVTKDIGNGLYTSMSWPEIKAVVGKAFSEPKYSYLYDTYFTSGVWKGIRFELLWDSEISFLNNEPASLILFSRSALDWIANPY